MWVIKSKNFRIFFYEEFFFFGKKLNFNVIVFSIASAKKPDYMDVVSLQSFSGSWKLSDALAAVIGKSIDVLKTSAPIKVLLVLCYQ